MKRLILIAVLGLMVSTGAFAQRVYKDGSNRVILDLSVAAGMPAGAVDATPKTWVGTPNNTTGPMVNNKANESLNAKVYPKLEIAPYDMKDNGVIDDVTSGTFVMFWAAAFNGCKGSASFGGGWRLPTQRELMYMYIFKSAFDALLPRPIDLYTYWSATEYYISDSWYVNFRNSKAYYVSRTINSKVRCVREL